MEDMESEITSVENEMAKITKEFLKEISKKLRKQYAQDISGNYLFQMVDHLKMFYKDVTDELAEKEERIKEEIEGLLREAVDLKRNLNVDFEIYNNANNVLPLTNYKKRIDQDLENMRTLYNRRKQEIEFCLAEQSELCEALGEPRQILTTDPLANESDVQDFQMYLLDLKTEKLRRENEIEHIKQEIGGLCEELELTMNSCVNMDFPPNKENMNLLHEQLSDLQHKREEIKRESNQMIEKLDLLWDFLEVPAAVRTNFRNMAETCKPSSVELIKDELKRCKQIRQENIKLFVDKLRIQIIAQWDKVYKSEEERKRFKYMECSVYTDDLLDLHELELNNCKQYYEDNRLIFEKFNERNNWWEKMIALEAKQNEPGRYNNRGGQLLREEKERKQLNLKLPEIEEEIRQLVEDYRNKTGLDFLINGEPITDLIERDWEKMRAVKENLKSARKATTNLLTPNHRGAATPKTPMSIRGQTSTMKRLASTTNLAAASGNTGKKMLLEVQNRGNNVTTSSKKVESTMSRTPGPNRNQTKRNLINQLNSPNDFARPVGLVKQVRKPIKAMASLGVPTLPRRRSNGLSNKSASKIIKKYRLSNNKRRSRISTTTDESLVNYDMFENHMKSSQFTNSSVVEQQENMNMNHQNQQMKLTKTTTSISHTRTILKTPNRNNTINNTRSPILSASSKKLKTKNLGLII